jgi:hypothetical protein
MRDAAWVSPDSTGRKLLFPIAFGHLQIDSLLAPLRIYGSWHILSTAKKRVPWLMNIFPHREWISGGAAEGNGLLNPLVRVFPAKFGTSSAISTK